MLSPDAISAVIDDLRQRSKNDQYVNDPVKWAEDVLEVHLWSKQKEILMSLVDNKKTAVKSCHAIGKTFLSAIAACWWVSTRPNSMVRSTAPTYRQVHELLWEEIRKFHAQYKLVGRITQSDEWKRELFGTEIQVGSGSKPADGDIHGFHGVHRVDGVLVILDEACGVPDNLFTASDAITTGEYDRVLAVGNPDDPNTEFGRIFKDKSVDVETGENIWNLITVSAYDTPNFTGELVPEVVRKNLIQAKWVSQRKSEWGEDSSRFKAKILAEFPDQSNDSFFSQKSIDMAYETTIAPSNEYIVLGVDIAGHGDDDSVIYINKGGHVRHYESWSDGNAMYSARKVLQCALESGAHEVRIDGSGLGAAIVDAISEMPEMSRVPLWVRVNGGNQAQDQNAHLNARAEQYDTLRKLMESGQVDLDPEDESLNRQLLAIRYQFSTRGSIQIENKRDMRKRGVKSPDELDAVVYATMDTSHMFEAKAPEIEYEDPYDYVGYAPELDDILGW